MTNFLPPVVAAGSPDILPIAGRRGISVRCLSDEHDLAALDALDAAGLGAILLGEDGQAIAANALACELISRGDKQRLVGRRLALKTDGALSADNPYAPNGTPDRRCHLASLERNGGSEPLFAHVVGLGCAGDGPEGGRRLALLVDPARYVALRFEAFLSAYRLTSAEARLLAEILTGRGVGVACRSLGVTEPTARTHLKHIFAKTETTRQTELISRFFGTARPAPS